MNGHDGSMATETKAKTFRGIGTSYGPPWGGINGSGTTSGCGDPERVVDLTDGPCNVFVVAVDPSVIPCGSLVRVEPNPHGNPKRLYVAADTGGAIKGKRVDVYHCDRKKQLAYGRKKVKVTVYPPGTDTGGFEPTPDSGFGGGLLDNLQDAADAVNPLGDIIKFIARLFEPDFWVRVGKAILGVGALFFGVLILMKALFGVDIASSVPAAKAAKGAKKVVGK